MGSKTVGCRARSLKQALLMMGAIVVSSVLLAGCADKPTYEADYDQNFPFGQLNNYRWYDDDHNTRESQYRRRNSSDQRVRNTADQELLQRGSVRGAVGRQIFG